MRRVTLWALSTLTTLVLLFSYHTSTSSQGGGAPVIAQGPASAGSANGPSGGSSSGSASSGSSGSAKSGSSSSGSSGSAKSSSSSSAARTYDGGTAQTRWGPVRVRITVQGGKITDSRAVVYPNGNGRDYEINSYALPILDQEAVQAQTANIDMVSGATVTSDGYAQSLQSAIDQAHL
ncbi:MAG TPA: FMN-binding protein [Pedococcus sp.]